MMSRKTSFHFEAMGAGKREYDGDTNAMIAIVHSSLTLESGGFAVAGSLRTSQINYMSIGQSDKITLLCCTMLLKPTPR